MSKAFLCNLRPTYKGTWDKNIEYNNYVSVTYNNCLYISKQDVPINIEINNTEYWIEAFDLENISEDLNACKNNIEELQNFNKEYNVSNGTSNYNQIRGYSIYLASSYNIEEVCNNIEYMTSKGCNKISITIGFSIDYTNNSVIKNTPIEHLLRVLELTRNYAYKILKVHCTFNQSEDNTLIMNNYGAALEFYIPYLNSYNINTYVISNEATAVTTSTYVPYWTNIINNIKAGYSGNISMSYTLGTGGQTSKSAITSLLDVLCVNVYPSLSYSTTYTLNELCSNWRYHLDLLQEFKEKNNNKQLIITETGCQPRAGRLGMTGLNNIATSKDYNVQYMFYKSIFVLSASFIDGVFLWEFNKKDESYCPLSTLSEPVALEFLRGGK